MYSWKIVPMKLYNRIFKAFLQIKESLNSINFDLPKQLLVSTTTHPCTGWINFDWSWNYEKIIYLCVRSYYV